MKCFRKKARFDNFNVRYFVFQAITKDAGIVELGAVVCYSVKDALACVSSVQDFGKVIRTLGHSTLHKIINKKQMADLERDRKIVGAELKVKIFNLFLV